MPGFTMGEDVVPITIPVTGERIVFTSAPKGFVFTEMMSPS